MDSLVLWAIVILVIVVVAAVFIAFLQRKAQARAWSELATQLGLSFEAGANPLSPLAVKGVYDGRELVVDTFSRVRRSGGRTTRKTFTQMVMTISNPADMQLMVSEESIFSQIGKVLGAVDIQVGDAEIDRRFTIKGQPQEVVLTIVSSETLRQRLLSLRQIDLRIQGTTIRYEHPGVEKDVQRLRDLVDLLSEFASAVERAG